MATGRGVFRHRFRGQRGRRWIPSKAGGTTQFASVGGTLTASGALVHMVGKPVAGATTPAGALSKSIGKLLAGAITPSGAVTAVKVALLTLTGALTPSGVLLRTAGKALTGAVTTSGSVLWVVGKQVSGAILPVGSLLWRVAQTLAGTLTLPGAVVAVKVALLPLAGTLTLSGSVVQQGQKVFAASVTSAGVLVRSVGKLLTGVLAPTGERLSGTLFPLAVSGVLTMAGAVARLPQKALAGQIAMSGSVRRAVAVTLTGVLTCAGSLGLIGPGTETELKRILTVIFDHRKITASKG